MENNDIAKLILNLNIGLFSDKSSYTTDNVVRNLENRTHYVDKSTLKYFDARIVAGSDSCSGTLFRLIESLPNGYQGKRGFRFVAFDVFGTVLNEREFFTSSANAQKAFYKWLELFDLTAHYREVFATRASRAKRDHDDLREAFNATFGA